MKAVTLIGMTLIAIFGGMPLAMVLGLWHAPWPLIPLPVVGLLSFAWWSWWMAWWGI